MRYAIVILLVLLLAAPAFAVTDDSNLKVFALTPDKMLGAVTGSNYEDSPNFPDVRNLTSENTGLMSFSHGDSIEINGTYVPHINYNWSIIEASDNIYTWAPDDTTKQPTRYNKLSGGSESHEVMLHCHFSGYAGELFITEGLYSGTNEIYTVCEQGIYILDKDAPAGAELYSSNPFSSYTMRTFATWKNRLFAAGDNKILYSKAGDFTNFNFGSFQGGLIAINPQCTIYKIMAASEGIYLFTSAGIYYLSGSVPETWRLVKVSDLRLKIGYTNLVGGVTNNVLFPVSFMDLNTVVFVDNLNSIYTINNGYSINKITDTIYPFPDTLSFFNKRFLILSNYLFDNTYVYDLQTKGWFRYFAVCYASENYYTSTYSTSCLPPSSIRSFAIYKKNINSNVYNNAMQASINGSKTNYYKIFFQTPFYTLDGNGATYKKLKKVEVDCKPYFYKDSSAIYEGGAVSGKSNNVLAFHIDTDKQTVGVTREVNLTNNISSYVNPSSYSITYILRYPELTEFHRLKMIFETTGGIIIKSIKFYYETAGVK